MLCANARLYEERRSGGARCNLAWAALNRSENLNLVACCPIGAICSASLEQIQLETTIILFMWLLILSRSTYLDSGSQLISLNFLSCPIYKKWPKRL